MLLVKSVYLYCNNNISKECSSKIVIISKMSVIIKIIVTLTICYYIKIVFVLTVCIIILKLLLNQHYLLY